MISIPPGYPTTVKRHVTKGMLRSIALAILATFTCVGFGCSQPVEPVNQVPSQPAPEEPAAVYVGSKQCANCHADIFEAWLDSHHDLALQSVSDASILAVFTERENSERVTPAPFPRADVRFVFGISPLQQYLVAAKDGRLQAHPTAWDTRPADKGGQRWFNIRDGSFPAGDPMHWTGRANNWNSTCADCHSTAVRKGYDAVANSYETTWEAEDVACEACHGPASRHMSAHQYAGNDAPQITSMLDLSSQDRQINACAPCHSRRSQLAEGFQPDKPFLDFYSPSLLRPDLYYIDGQILDEVYVYGSFLQSKMHHRGVTCTNCHDPHTATLKLAGNALCTQCHQTVANSEFPTLQTKAYDTPDHHFHAPDTPGAQCVSCHMVATVYMGIDGRRDHSFRIPRPDLSASLEVPNACTGCHETREPVWATEVIAQHFGPERAPHPAATFAAAARQQPGADAELAALAGDTQTPIMLRASALALLGGYARGYTLDAVRQGIAAKDGLLRIGAIQGAASLSPQARWRFIAPLLEDELHAIAEQAFLALLPLAADDLQYRQRLQPAYRTYLERQISNLDFPETLTNNAVAQFTMGQSAAAEKSLNQALELQPSWVPALLNLADLYRATERDEQAGALLEQAMEIVPAAADPVYSYALWLTRNERPTEALDYFQQAVSLEPSNSRNSYAYAIALNDDNQAASAINLLLALTQTWPDDQAVLTALVTILRDEKRFDEALIQLDRLILLRPDDPNLREFRQVLTTAQTTG